MAPFQAAVLHPPQKKKTRWDLFRPIPGSDPPGRRPPPPWLRGGQGTRAATSLSLARAGAAPPTATGGVRRDQSPRVLRDCGETAFPLGTPPCRPQAELPKEAAPDTGWEGCPGGGEKCGVVAPACAHGGARATRGSEPGIPRSEGNCLSSRRIVTKKPLTRPSQPRSHRCHQDLPAGAARKAASSAAAWTAGPKCHSTEKPSRRPLRQGTLSAGTNREQRKAPSRTQYAAGGLLAPTTPPDKRWRPLAW